MKPTGPVARRRDYVVEECSHAAALEFITTTHYARGASRTAVHTHRLRRVSDGAMVGAAMWLPPTKVAAQSVAGEQWREVLSLSRLAVSEGEPQNAASLLLGGSMRLVARDERWSTYLTYADTRHGHTGAIYRATNWQYVGAVGGGRRGLTRAPGARWR